MKIYEYLKTHSFIYSQTCTGTYTYTTAQTHLKNACAHTTRTCIHAHSLTNAQLHIHVQLCSCTHSLTYSLIHSVTHSLAHSLTYFNSLTLTRLLSLACSYRHTHMRYACMYICIYTVQSH